MSLSLWSIVIITFMVVTITIIISSQIILCYHHHHFITNYSLLSPSYIYPSSNPVLSPSQFNYHTFIYFHHIHLKSDYYSVISKTISNKLISSPVWCELFYYIDKNNIFPLSFFLICIIISCHQHHLFIITIIIIIDLSL